MKVFDIDDFPDDDIESLRQLDKEDLIRLFLKVRLLFWETAERCNKLEKENLELTSLDKLFEDL